VLPSKAAAASSLISSSRRWSPAPAVRASLALHAAAFAGLIAVPWSWPWWLGAVAANHLVLGMAGMVPRTCLLGPNITRLPDRSVEGREVALTFDDGPDPRVTPLVLDLLDRHGAQASFFCIGKRAAAHPELIREIRRRGHGVENHSHTHPYLFACYPFRRLLREVGKAQNVIAATAGVAPRFFRPPAGLRSPLLDPVLARTGLHHVSWSRRGGDGIRGDPRQVLAALLDGLAPGDIILLHDGNCARTRAGEPVVLAVLPSLLESLARLGLRPVSLSAAFGAAELSGQSDSDCNQRVLPFIPRKSL
jgi:peptidoglycan-N-acetylglucosamine deacetylase